MKRPIYVSNPYILLSDKEDVVLDSGTKEEMEELRDNGYCGYYKNCLVKVREHDLYLIDNTKLAKKDTKLKKEINIKLTQKESDTLLYILRNAEINITSRDELRKPDRMALRLINKLEKTFK